MIVENVGGYRLKRLATLSLNKRARLEVLTELSGLRAVKTRRNISQSRI